MSKTERPFRSLREARVYRMLLVGERKQLTNPGLGETRETKRTRPPQNPLKVLSVVAQ